MKILSCFIHWNLYTEPKNQTNNFLFNHCIFFFCCCYFPKYLISTESRILLFFFWFSNCIYPASHFLKPETRIKTSGLLYFSLYYVVFQNASPLFSFISVEPRSQTKNNSTLVYFLLLFFKLPLYPTSLSYTPKTRFICFLLLFSKMPYLSILHFHRIQKTAWPNLFCLFIFY